MGDVVQAALERMLPDLDDLLARKLLSADEVRAVVRARRAHEYALAARGPADGAAFAR